MRNNNIREAQQLWAKYKYCIMERSYYEYKKISKYFSEDNVKLDEIRQILGSALLMDLSKGQVINTLQHVWGYFKKIADEQEKISFFSSLKMYENDECTLQEVKVLLYELASKYNIKYLLDSFYFKTSQEYDLYE
ncbi:YbgA family protein [Clostridium sp. YIM B02505]|uniref:YbgA family protein n=1 Tax=Clostridium yunnanense TaxID=2800325 RepID=A0ABS1EUG6_9CLOT|nr:YbgA family protein [Clostridium yunnanense]MBK1812980.1 YbgA family protein [Clostridium yunnanense]